MRSLEFENDDLFGEPGRVYRGAAADINEYSNPLGEFRVSNIEYEELQSAIADALGYNWNDAEYEALTTPLYRTVDDPLADFFDNVLNDNPRSESDRYVEQLVSVLKSNYQRFGTEPRAAIDGATRALEHGYSMARAVDIDDDITESDNDNDLFGPPTKQSKLSALKIHADLGPEFSQYLLGLPTQDEDNRAWFAELTPEEMEEYRAIAQAFARGTRAGYQRMHQSRLQYLARSIDEIVDSWKKKHILLYQYNGSMPLKENDDDLFEPQTGGKFWSNEPSEYQRLYAELVPPHGPASTLEGELLRAASRLYYQYFNNGWFNNVSGAENFLRQFAQSTPAMQRALYTIHPYTRCDTQDLENKQTARQVEIALDTILQGVMRQVQAANGRYHPNTDNMYDMFDYEQPDDDVEPADDYDDYEEPDYDEDDEELNENDDDLFAAPGESGAAAKMRRQTERIVQTIEELVRLSMPDGDPIDYVFPYMLRKNLDMNQLEAILRMHGYQDIYAMRDEIMQSLDDENLDIQLESDDLFEPSQRVKILHAIRGMRRGGDSNGTSLQGKVRTTYGQLLQTFGKPMFGPDERDYDKVSCEWVVTFGDDSVATIYDWKTGRATPRGEYDWHIGGHRKVVTEYVRVALELGRDAVVTEDDDDLFEPRPGYIPADVVAKIMPGVETFMRYLEDDTDMKGIREQDPENYRNIIRDFQGAAQELRRGNVIKALAYIENSPQFFDLDDWFLTVILRRTGIDLSDYYDTENDRLNNLFWKYMGEIKALREYGMGGFVETNMREVREFVEWTRRVVTEDQDDDLFEPTASPILLKLYRELAEVCDYAQEQGYQDYDVDEMMRRSSQTWEEIFERLGGQYNITERDIIKAATAEERQDLIQDMTYYLQELRDELDLTESDRKKKTQTKTDQPGLDPNMFAPKQDQPLARQEPQPDQTTDQPRDIRRASAARTRQATAGITPTDQMRDMLGRLRNIEIDPNLAPYPTDDPTREISVDVNTQNLPAVAGANMQAAGVQNPEFYQVAALPGNMAAVIRQLGKSLFASMTSTPTNNIYVVANLGGQGPNTTQEVNAVAGYLRDHAVNIGPGDIDFSKIMPGYSAETNMFSAGGIRWLLVRDFAGQYIYAWPEADSVDYGQEPKKLR